jgi:two-component system sensor histidine kinase YesM
MSSGMVLLGLVLLLNMYYSIRKSTYENIDLMVNTTVASVEQSMVLVQNTSLEIAASNAITSWLKDGIYYNKRNELYFKRKEMLKNEIQRIIGYSNARKLNLISYATIFADDQMLEYTYIQQMGINTIQRESFQVYELLKEKDEEFLFNLPIDSVNNTIFYVRRMKTDFESDSQLVILLATKEQELRKKYQELVKGNGDIVFLLDRQKKIFSSNSNEDIGTIIDEKLYQSMSKKQGEEVTYHGITYYAVLKEAKESGHQFVYLYPKSVITENAINGMTGYVRITIFIMIIFVIIGLLMSLKSTQFINEFIYVMKSVKEKNYDIKVKKFRDPEINLLGETFNDMTAEIKELIQNKYESQLLLNEMEIRFLQHQMNPHFLFNVLLTIQIKAKRCGDESVFKMISALSALLRASIYTNKRDKVTVREELEYVEFYLYLQKMRFKDRLKYVIEVTDDKIYDCKIPKFIIEPLVENAVIHGVEEMERDAIITISLRKKNELMIIVEDNGMGFDVEEYLADSAKPEKEDQKREKIGMRNVDIRLKHIFGETYGLKINSKINEGTIIEINIPTV